MHGLSVLICGSCSVGCTYRIFSIKVKGVFMNLLRHVPSSRYVDLLTDNPSAQERHQIRKRRSYRRSIRQFPRPPCGNDSTVRACDTMMMVMYGSNEWMCVLLQGMKSQVCQNCAKITRMRGAYEECCANENNAYSWCKRIFDFTNPLG